jgi:hypothetical protein
LIRGKNYVHNQKKTLGHFALAQERRKPMTQLIHVSEIGLPFTHFAFIVIGIVALTCFVSFVRAEPIQKLWQIGAPIVTYWAGPPMTDAVAKQMADGNWNLVWCRESELDTAHKYGLRALLHDPLLNSANLDQPDEKAKLDALIQRVRNHPALYSYYIIDEPSASTFSELGRLTAYLRECDPLHNSYINLFPIYANNQQLGTTGEPIPAYEEHLRQFVEIIKPNLISYDHYHFAVNGDGSQYFLNLAMIRQTALDARVPFLNIVQACSWDPSMRIPTGDELRWLVYTSLAYGAQGISYYVYCHPNHEGAMATADGIPTPLYYVAKDLNHEFALIASQLQPLQSLGVYHVGMLPPGTLPLPNKALFTLDPPLPVMDYNPSQPVEGLLLGYFGEVGSPSHVLVVNLDYKQNATRTIVGPGQLEIFDTTTGKWLVIGNNRVELSIQPGGGTLVRVAR